MSSPGAQQITVRHDGTERVFDATQQITMGRAPEVLLFVDSPLVSRVHATLSYEAGSWMLTDNGSTNGVFVDARRLTTPLVINRPTQVRLGDAISGPLLHLLPQSARGGQAPQPQPQRQGMAPPPNRPPSRPQPQVGQPQSAQQPPVQSPYAQQRPPANQQARPNPQQAWPNPSQANPQLRPNPNRPYSGPQHQQSVPQHQQPAQQQPNPVQQRQAPHVGAPPTPNVPRPPVNTPPSSGDAINMTTKADTSALPPIRARASTAAIARADRIPRGGLNIGRTSDNQIVVNDPMASRNHARLVADREGLAIEDLNSANGTFVNGRREQRALLRERDIITIGNVDFVVQEGTLVRRQRPVAEQGLHVHGVSFTVEGNKQLLIDVNMQAGRGSLTALIGPSGAGKSTLSKLIAGTTHPSAGVVTFEGRNLHAEYEALRSRIGMVPQDDVLHRQLTVKQALNFAAQLRLPPDTSKADRKQVIEDVLKELSLTQHADTRVDRLSGGQRKRASVAMELLTGPSLLILDEPTSGLDPALDRQVMTMLRELADAGRTVIVVTHSVACLDMCDQVLLLAPGGKTAFCGHPGSVGHVMGTSDWAEIFGRVAADPDRAFANFRSRQAFAEPPAPVKPVERAKAPKSSPFKQFSTLSRRQLRLIFADRGYLAFLGILPFVLAGLSLVVPGKNGFESVGFVQAPDGSFVRANNGEAQQLLVVLILGACFLGVALTVRDLVGERAIYFRERAVGLRSGAYLMSKIVVFSLAAMLQSAVMIAIVLVVKKPPSKGAVIPSGPVELYLDVALTAVCCVVLGLALSALAKSNEQVMPLLVVIIMAQLVMAGGLIPVTGRAVLDQISWLFPSRWGYSAGASTVNLPDLSASDAAQKDHFWKHTVAAWSLDMGVLAAILVLLALFTWSRLRLKKSAA
ncbi:ATP-binding cassette domain-containing protein [Nocardia sp. ET3-3]|uniref:ATP-binding cassette domain-containing protein n=1 Tax=Nocardia terrae TaxID=2675851 RepID=A0A7K1UWX7_9NOCA|nr:ATP-binding cassette domain-containing protein [Nocardia terrae]MVU78890.1 ATP-binding cassette domain-containing protein [Nocardia terrae]